MNLEEMRRKALEDARHGLKKSFAKRDALIIQTVSAMDEADKTINVLSERLREWYSLHFPELDRAVPDHKAYAKLAFVGDRNQIEDKQASKLAKGSIGADLGERDYKIISEYSKRILDLYYLRDQLEAYLGTKMKELAPNVNAIAGPSVGARLIKLAGSLENLAKLPSSTVQVLGAEKALFMHLKKHTKPPKHGVIFQCPIVHNSPKQMRGRLSRTIAAKTSIGAKIDFYNPHLDENLVNEFNSRINRVMAKK